MSKEDLVREVAGIGIGDEAAAAAAAWGVRDSALNAEGLRGGRWSTLSEVEGLERL